MAWGGRRTSSAACILFSLPSKALSIPNSAYSHLPTSTSHHFLSLSSALMKPRRCALTKVIAALCGLNAIPLLLFVFPVPASTSGNFSASFFSALALLEAGAARSCACALSTAVPPADTADAAGFCERGAAGDWGLRVEQASAPAACACAGAVTGETAASAATEGDAAISSSTMSVGGGGGGLLPLASPAPAPAAGDAKEEPRCGAGCDQRTGGASCVALREACASPEEGGGGGALRACETCRWRAEDAHRAGVRAG